MSVILDVKNLKKTFTRNGLETKAVKGVSFSIERGECLGLVGESGCGKSTTANMILRLIEPDDGQIRVADKANPADYIDVCTMKERDARKIYRTVQMVFQNPQDSFDPRRTLGAGICEGMINAGISKADACQRMYELMSMVELEPELAKRYPHEVSGGQCQRAAIARAMATKPDLLICDEATSALDVTVQAQIAELLSRLKRELDLSILLICHDLALVQHMCDRVLVMYQGQIIEEGKPDEIICNPKEDYTNLLIRSVL